MTHPLFLYGALLDPAIQTAIAGRELIGTPAVLPDHDIQAVEDHAVVFARPGATAHGMLVDVDPQEIRRLDFYLRSHGLKPDLQTLGNGAQATVYKASEGASDSWSLERWQSEQAPLARVVASELMHLIDTHAPDDVTRALPQIRMRAASRLRATAQPSPSTLLPKMDAQAESRETAIPYTDYFAVREDHLSFPRFNGGMSQTVKRASFLGGDAVTVLPFDPAANSVLMVRQFRHGPYSRGDANPWTLEPAAGRIDPGETPEATARRELLEETGVDAQAVHFVGRYYPTPGAFSEYLFSYVAEADLSKHDGHVGGLETEAEDIMAHVIDLDAALAMISTGEINTGPLILSLQWLALHRATRSS